MDGELITAAPSQTGAPPVTDDMSREEALAVLDDAQRLVDRAIRRRPLLVGLVTLVLLALGAALMYLAGEYDCPVAAASGGPMTGAGLLLLLCVPVVFFISRAEPARYRACFASLRATPGGVAEVNMTKERSMAAEEWSDVETTSVFLTVKTAEGKHRINVTRQDREALRRAVERLTGLGVSIVLMEREPVDRRPRA